MFIIFAKPSAIHVSTASAARAIARFNPGLFVGLEPGQHVVGQVAPCHRRGPRRCGAAHSRSCPERSAIDRKPLWPPSVPRRARPQPAQRQVDVVADDQEVGSLDLVVPGERRDRLAAQVHERERLDEQHDVVRPPPLAPAARRPAPSRTPARAARASRSTTSNPTLCRVPRYFAPGLPSPATSFMPPQALTSPSCPFLVLVLLDLALLDDLGLGRRRRCRRRGRIGRRRFLGSTFGATTCTISMSASLTAFHLPSVGRSRTRTPSCSISSVTSTRDVLRNVGRQALDHDLAMHEVDDAALGLDALGLAGQVHRHGHAQDLVHRDAIEVGVQQLVRRPDASWYSLTSTRASRRAVDLQRDQRVDADCECRIRSSAFGSTASDSAWRGLAVEHRRNLALAAQAAGFVLAESIAADGFECRFHDCYLSSLARSRAQAQLHEQLRDRRLFVNAANGLRQQARDRQHHDLLAGGLRRR